MDLFNDSPFGSYTTYELQEWIKALQFKCCQQSALLDVHERILRNNDRLAENERELRELQEKMIQAQNEQIYKLERALNTPPSLNRQPICLN